MLFIGDYVSPEDTATAFEQAKLLDRVWTYDTTKPPPTLREMVEARRTLLVLAEHKGGTPRLVHEGLRHLPGHAVHVRRRPSSSAAPRTAARPTPRSSSSTTSSPTASRPRSTEARTVNAYDVLMPRAEQCMQERRLLPNIIAVDFYDQGDLLKVVQDLNERDLNEARAPSDATTTSAG